MQVEAYMDRFIGQEFLPHATLGNKRMIELWDGHCVFAKKTQRNKVKYKA